MSKFTLENFVTDETSLEEFGGAPIAYEEDVRVEDFAILLGRNEVSKLKVGYAVVGKEVDIVGTVKKYKDLYKAEVDKLRREFDEKYQREINKLKNQSKDMLTGKFFTDFAKRANEIGWQIILTKNKVVAYKSFMDAPFPVQEGLEGDEKLTYEKPLCRLLGIYIDLSEGQITSHDSVKIQTLGRHPNASGEGDLTGFCLGGMNGETFDISNPDTMIGIMNQVESIVKTVSPESPHSREPFLDNPIKKREKIASSGGWSSKTATGRS